MTLSLCPITIQDANILVKQWHRHHKPVAGALFAIGIVAEKESLDWVGAAIVGRPVARMRQDGRTAEVVRLVTNGEPHACSMLYAACWRAWRAMGGARLGTYILIDEPGTSLKAAGWKWLYNTKGDGDWNVPSRPRSSDALGQKQLWEIR